MNKTLHCLKCNGNLIVENNQSLGKCFDCDSLHPLPKIFASESLDYRNAQLDKYNRANMFAREYHFHKAYNLYDKITKANPDDFYAYWGKVLAQYGVVYQLNDSLENEIISLRTNLGRVFDNENYLKAIELADKHALALIKKEALQIDRFNQATLMTLFKTTPMEVFILVDDTINNQYVEEDIKLANLLEEEFKKRNKVVYLPMGLFEKGNIVNFESTIFPAIEMAQIMIIISKDKQYEQPLFKSIWSRCRQKQNNNDQLTLYLLTDNGEKADFLTFKQNEINNLIDVVLNKLAKFDLTKPSLSKDELLVKNLLSERKYEEALMQSRALLSFDNSSALWWLAFLAKNALPNEDALLNWDGMLEDDFYFQKAYLQGSLPEKLFYFELMTKRNENQKQLKDEKLALQEKGYQKLIEAAQKGIYLNNLKRNIKYFLLLFAFIVISFLTLSFGNFLSISVVIVGYGLLYALIIYQFIKVMRLGKVPKGEKAKDFIEKIKQSPYSLKVAFYSPSLYFNRLKLIFSIVGLICLSLTSVFFVKEITNRFKYNNLNYYYFFNEVIITGGQGEYVFIPAKINNRSVSSVQQYAFYGTKIKKVEIEAGIKKLGNAAFAKCQYLEMIILPSTINKVGELAPFEGCNENLKISYFRIIPLSSLLGKNYELIITGLNIIEE